MSEPVPFPDLFALGQRHFASYLQEFAAYGLAADPGLQLRRGTGLLCYYSLDDRQIYLSVPDFNQPAGKLQALLLRSLLGCRDNAELLRFLEIFLPHVIAHELAHHYRHRYGLFGQSLWLEEQIANKLSVAVIKHRLSPREKTEAQNILRRAIDTLSVQIQAKNIAIDSYYSVVEALTVSGQLGVADSENIELIEAVFKVDEAEIIKGSGQLSPELLDRLEQRDDLIEQIDEQYASDQIKYIYYHIGWLYLDLTSRETEYVDEFARTYLDLKPDLLPIVDVPDQPTDEAVLACYRAYLDTGPRSETAGRYFYRRYRALLLARLQNVELRVAVQSDRLKKEAGLILERWSDREADTLNYLAQLAPPELRRLFPHLVADQARSGVTLPGGLPTETDRRLWQQVMVPADDPAAANTLYRLSLLDRTDVYRPLPAELMLKLIHNFCLALYEPGEAVIWQDERNDDVFILLEGRLEVLLERNGQVEQVGQIHPGELFGEVAFFTEDPRYATVRAVEPCRCFVLKDSDLQLFGFEHPTMLMQMAGVLAKRLADLYQLSRNEIV